MHHAVLQFLLQRCKGDKLERDINSLHRKNLICIVELYSVYRNKQSFQRYPVVRFSTLTLKKLVNAGEKEKTFLETWRKLKTLS